jgi:SNF2 family DNA or RNA helicase
MSGRPAKSDVRRTLSEVEQLTRQGQQLRKVAAEAEAEVRRLIQAEKQRIALEELATQPIGRLRETAKGLRLDALERAGLRTLAQAATVSEQQLRLIPGVGEETARRVVAAARQVYVSAHESAKVRFSMEDKPARHAELLAALRRHETAQRAWRSQEASVTWLQQVVPPTLQAARPARASGLRRLFYTSATKSRAAQAIGSLNALLADERAQRHASTVRDALVDISRPRSPEQAWADYQANAAALLGVLGELTGDADHPGAYGQLPRDLVIRVTTQPLDLSLMSANLRGYQAFGARFALAQRRVIVGDEMGLGKTLEALAVAAHLGAHDRRRVLVVCPASVVANWEVEVRRHTRLTPVVVYGLDRLRAYRVWQRTGGVAITTFHTAGALPPPASAPDALIVDEAHYAKNPAARRSQAVRRWANDTELTVFLTGTPMENRVDEFRSLVDILQPPLARSLPSTAGLAGAAGFRRAVAPVYLRRNQADVLDELPPRIEALAWVNPTPADHSAYRRAVVRGNFMAMRRAPFVAAAPANATSMSKEDIERSAKLDRLCDLVGEAAEEGLKVIVFSFFRDVLALVSQAVPVAVGAPVIGPLSGSTPPAVRQEMVDRMTATSGPAVLAAQIEAGGTGLNIQAASVVVLCEPQWKPTVEAQAIGRAHRMGQVRRVRVYRLIARHTADEHVLAILARKSQLFEHYAARSELKEVSPDAIDISDLQEVDKVVSEAEIERLIIRAERKRMGLSGDDPEAA